MEEVTRFYHHFGLSLGGESRELPDHITTELEFMHFLTFREVAALENGQDRGPYVRAERDFLQRHLKRWLPRVRPLAEKQKAAPFFLGLLALAEAFLLNDLAHVASLAGAAPPGRPPEATKGQP
jgi:DMSO reductase family type II enzyme chaperone